MQGQSYQLSVDNLTTTLRFAQIQALWSAPDDMAVIANCERFAK